MSDEVQQNTVSTEQAPLPPQLTLGDLTLVLNTIQVVSQRGAIRADEMEAVGGLYNRLFKFLEAAGAIQPAPAQQPQANTPDSSDEEQQG